MCVLGRGGGAGGGNGCLVSLPQHPQILHRMESQSGLQGFQRAKEF